MNTIHNPAYASLLPEDVVNRIKARAAAHNAADEGIALAPVQPAWGMSNAA